MQRPRLETLTNVALLIACVSVTGVAVKRFVWTDAGSAGPAVLRHSEGEVVLPPASVSFASRPRTALVFLSSQCKFCSESMPFYEELSKGRKRGNFQLVVAGYEARQSLVDYLKEHDVEVDYTLSIKPGTFKFPGTPSIVVVDSAGRVQGQWNGALRGRESEVQKLLMN